MRSVLMIAAVLGLLGANLEPAFAQFYGPGQWCAVIGAGSENMYWDCQYRSIEECRPHVIAGDRGWCNLNPSFVAGPTERGHSGKPHARSQ
jgi:hypothetical protein